MKPLLSWIQTLSYLLRMISSQSSAMTQRSPATMPLYSDARSIRVLSDTGEVLRCVQSHSRGAQSSFILSDTLFGVDLSVEASILFYDENPPSDALEEHYTITATRNNGEVIEINYPAIGADTASVTYPQNGRTVTIEVPTASAPFDL